jgi:hypothetical protein
MKMQIYLFKFKTLTFLSLIYFSLPSLAQQSKTLEENLDAKHRFSANDVNHAVKGLSDNSVLSEISRASSHETTYLWRNEPFGQRDASKELTEKRDAFSKHFQNDNGSITAHIASGPIHYEENGQWKTIYHTIEPASNGGFQNVHNSFKTYFPATASGEILTVLPDGTEMRDMQGMRMYYEVNGQEVGAMNIGNTPGSVDFNKLTYPAVYGPHIDLRLTQNSTQRKMDYLLQNASSLNGAPQNAQYLVFEEQIILPQGVTARLADNKITLTNEKGDVIAEYTNPDIYDEQPADTEDENYLHRSEATYQIEQNGASLTIKTKVEMTWLLDVNRNFPVVVDPTVNIFPNIQNWWSWIAGLNNSGAQGNFMGVGQANLGTGMTYWRSAVQFNTSSVPLGSTINGLTLFYYQQFTIGWPSTSNNFVRFRQFINDVSAVPFSNSWLGLHNMSGGGTQYAQSATGAHSTTNIWRNQNLGATAASYFQNTSINQGRFGIGMDYGGSYNNTNRYVEFTGCLPANRPYIEVDYTEPNCGTNSTTQIVNNDNTGITNVTFNTINNTTTSNNTYVNTGISTTVCRGQTYPLSVSVNTAGAWTVRARAWIDWNNDGIFSNTTESYDLGTAFNTASGLTSLSPFSITVPANAALGNIKMRIVAAEISNYPHACATNLWGEGEDYILIVQAPPTAPTGISGTTTICNGQSTTLTAIGGGNGSGATFQWGTGAVVGSNVIAGQTAATLTVSPTTTTTYWVRRVGNTACNNTTGGVTTTVTVQTPPTAPTGISGTTTICNGQSTTLTATGGGNGSGATFQWGTGAVGSNVIAGQTAATLTVSPTATTTYWVRRVGNTACSGATGGVTATVTVNQPNTVITVANNNAAPGDFIWNGQVSSDWGNANNWYQKTSTGYTLASVAPTLADNVFVVPSSVGGSCISASNAPIVNVLTLGSGTAQDVFIHQDSELALDVNTTLEVTGDFYSLGQFSAGLNSVVEFKGGDDAKVLITNPQSNKFYNLSMNKSNASKELALESNIHVENEVSFTQGNIRLNQFTLDLGSSGFFAGESEDSYAYCDCPTGRIVRTVPIGANATVNAGNLGIAITPAVNMGTVKVERYHETIIDPNNNMPQSIVRKFTVKDELGGPVQNNGNLDADIVFHYLDAELNGVIGALSLYHRAGGQNFWDEYGGTHDPIAKTVTYEGFPSFSDVTLAPFNSPLPVTFGGFNSECTSEGVQLTWTTHSEQNASHWLIERSRDGVTWDVLANVPAYGNTNSSMYYEYADAKAINFDGYYRLFQVDFDGLSEYFGPFYVGCLTNDQAEMNVNVYPNPATQHAYLEIKLPQENQVAIHVVLMDATGRIIHAKDDIIKEMGVQHWSIEQLQNGLYTFQVCTSDGDCKIAKFVVNR